MNLNIFLINKPPEEDKESKLQKMLKEKRHIEKMQKMEEISERLRSRPGSYHEGGG